MIPDPWWIKRTLYEGIMAVLEAIKKLAERYAEKAAELAKRNSRSDPEKRAGGGGRCLIPCPLESPHHLL